jgi:hypothetical protein
MVLADTKQSQRGADICKGTKESDTFLGTGSPDSIRGLKGNGTLWSSGGVHKSNGGVGEDTLKGDKVLDNGFFSNN